jgi:hypothetical protein
MSATQFPLLGERESLEVLHWRYDSLVRAGYSERQALELAAEVDADLHLAVELVQRGCPPDTAIRILK